MKLKALIFVCTFAACIVSCKKESGQTTLRVRMTDAPAALEKVNIDLREVNIKFTGDTSAWVTMDTRAGVYNLLGLQNGIDTLIASGTYPTATVKEIRLVVGANNSVVEGGQTYPLTIPSGASSGLKIKIDKDLRAGIDSVVIDFDAALSIRPEADGYKLRPVLRVKN